jgi:hypothetical protein
MAELYFVIWVSAAGVRCDDPAADTAALDVVFEALAANSTE